MKLISILIINALMTLTFCSKNQAQDINTEIKRKPDKINIRNNTTQSRQINRQIKRNPIKTSQRPVIRENNRREAAAIRNRNRDRDIYNAVADSENTDFGTGQDLLTRFKNLPQRRRD